MTLYEGELFIPQIEIEDQILWLWLRDKFNVEREFNLNGGYIVSVDSLQSHYMILFKHYVEF